MALLSKGRYRARFAQGEADLAAAQALRFRTFIDGRGAALGGERADGREADAFDAVCDHILVEEARTNRLVCCFRMLPLAGGAEIGRSYSAQYYDLNGFADYEGRLVEMGRFCIDPAYKDPDILRVAWGAMTRYVDEQDVDLLFGCSSFAGTEAESYMDAFALLKERHLAPPRLFPKVKAPSVFRFAKMLRWRKPNLKLAQKAMPPLLRTYLAMGGWVSDHAVVDRDLNTLHVFTGLEVKRIPPARARLLRATAG